MVWGCCVPHGTDGASWYGVVVCLMGVRLRVWGCCVPHGTDGASWYGVVVCLMGLTGPHGMGLLCASWECASGYETDRVCCVPHGSAPQGMRLTGFVVCLMGVRLMV